ncbi:MAG: hypothetical protein J0H82_21715 [Alphaproteobacteria bacterium]|jgi:hypothetical protein|nr:hypothetical protein [Alphaproteobacteria bacterium]
MIGGIGPLRATQYVRAAAPTAAPSAAPVAEAASGSSNGVSAGAAATPTFAGGLSQSTLLTAQASGGSSQSASGLTEEEQAVVREMKQTDAKVRAHEMAHLAAGGQFASGPSYEFEKGPDGGLYAVAGEVNIDTSPIPGDPEATIAKANQIRAAALAPGDPSAQDRSVANAAAQMAAKASVEAAKQKNGETGETTSPPTDTPSRAPNSQAAQAASNAYGAVSALVAAAQQPTLNLAA